MSALGNYSYKPNFNTFVIGDETGMIMFDESNSMIRCVLDTKKL